MTTEDKTDKIFESERYNNLPDYYEAWVDVINDLKDISKIDSHTHKKLLALYKQAKGKGGPDINYNHVLLVNLIYNILFKK